MGKSAIVFKVMVTLRFYLEYIFIGAWTERKRGGKKSTNRGVIISGITDIKIQPHGS